MYTHVHSAFGAVGGLIISVHVARVIIKLLLLELLNISTRVRWEAKDRVGTVNWVYILCKKSHFGLFVYIFVYITIVAFNISLTTVESC